MNLLLYLLPIAGLILGVTLGWIVRGQRLRQFPENLPASEIAPDSREDQMPLLALAIDPSTAIKEAEIRRWQMQVYLTKLTEEITALQSQISVQEKEQTRLLNDLEEHPVWTDITPSIPNHARETYPSDNDKTEDMLSRLNERIEELDALQDMHDSYQVKINRLTQQVQRQDDKLRMLYQTLRSKTAELNEAQALLDRRDSERQRVIRQRELREKDIARELDLLAQRDEEFQGLIQNVRSTEVVDSTLAGSLVLQQDSVHVTRPALPRALPSGPGSDGPDDLTEIPGLAKMYAVQLQEHGIETFDQLSRSRPEDIQRMLNFPGHYSPDIRGWIAAAKRFVDGRDK